MKHRERSAGACAALVLYLCSTLCAQIDPAKAGEVRRRLGTSALRPATHAATRPARGAAPKQAARELVARLKENAPPLVQDWWARQPELKARVAAQVQAEIARVQAEIAAINGRPTPLKEVRRGAGAGAAYETDFAELANRRSLVSEQKRKVAQLKKDLKFIETRAFFAIPVLDDFTRGQYGRLARYSLEVVKVIDETNLLVDARLPWEERGVQLWISGIPTADLHDESGHVAVGTPVLVMGTRQYPTGRGGYRTVPHVEAIDLEAWVEVVAE